MKIKTTYIMVMPLLLTILTGIDKRDLFEVTIVSTSLNKPKHTLNYEVKLKINNCNELCKKNLNLQVVPGQDLKNLMITKKNNKLLLINQSKHIYGNNGKFHLAYKIKDNVKVNEIIYFSKHATLLVIDGTKVIKKIPLKKFKGNYNAALTEYYSSKASAASAAFFMWSNKNESNIISKKLHSILYKI